MSLYQSIERCFSLISGRDGQVEIGWNCFAAQIWKLDTSFHTLLHQLSSCRVSIGLQSAATKLLLFVHMGSCILKLDRPSLNASAPNFCSLCFWVHWVTLLKVRYMVMQYLGNVGRAVITVLNISDHLNGQKPVDPMKLLRILSPSSSWSRKTRPKQRCLKLVQVAAKKYSLIHWHAEATSWAAGWGDTPHLIVASTKGLDKHLWSQIMCNVDERL